jgi:CBS-domain-containing membrane protein
MALTSQHGLQVGDLLTESIATVESEDEIEAAAWLFEKKRVDALAVVEAGRLAGLITVSDLNRALEAVSATPHPASHSLGEAKAQALSPETGGAWPPERSSRSL